MAFSLPGDKSSQSPAVAAFQPFSRPKRKKKKPQSGGGGGFLSDIAGGVTDAIGDVAPELGLGNAAKMFTGLPGAVISLGSSLAPGGVPAGQPWSAFGKGLLQSGSNTVSTILKPFGVPGTKYGASDIFESQINKATGYKPRDFFERSRDENVGFLPALLEDVGNVAMVAGGAGALAKGGELGTLANEVHLADEAATAGANGRLLGKVAKASEKAQGVRTAAEEAGRALPGEEAIAGRVRTLGRLQKATHPYQSVFNKVLRPLAETGSAQVVAGAAAEGGKVAEAAPSIAGAKRTLNEANAGQTGVVTPDEALQNLRDVQGRTTEEAVAASRVKLEEAAAAAEQEYLPETLKGYAAGNADLPLDPKAVEHTGAYDESLMGRIADQVDDPAFHDPNNPAVRDAYLGGTAEHPVGFLEQVKRQFQHLTGAPEQGGLGINVHFHGPGEPEYHDYHEMRADLEHNKNLRVRGTEAHGDTPNEFMAQVDPETGLSYNDMFRAIHDAFGHERANDFGRAGELTAFREHAQWFTPDVQQALAENTIGQTASLIKSKTPLNPEGVFPEQKAGLIDPALVEEARTGRAPGGMDVKVQNADAREIPFDEITEPTTVEGRNGTIEGVAPQGSPAEAAYRQQYLATLPGWSVSLVNRLPAPVVRMLDRVNGLIKHHDVNVVARERGRIVEAARRMAISHPAAQLAIEQVGRPLVGQVLPDGTRISRKIASEMAGAEIMARLDIADMIVQAGTESARPILEQAVNDVASQGKRIPSSMIDELGLEEGIQAATEAWRGAADERVATLIGGRLGTKGLEGIGEDVPTMTKRQVAAWKQAQKLMAKESKLQGKKAGEIISVVKDLERVDNAITRVTDAANADLTEAGAARDVVTGLYERQPFGGDDALKQQAISRILKATVDEGGGTLDTVSGELVTDADYTVAVHKGTLRDVPLQEWLDHGDEVINDLLANEPIFRDGRIHIGTWKHTGDDGQEYVAIDPSVTRWSSDPANPNATWRKLNRTQAILIGKAMDQESIWDAHANGGRGAEIMTRDVDVLQNLATHFVDLSLQRNSKFSVYERQLRKIVDQSVKHSEDRELAPTLDHVDADAQIQADMTMAYAWAKAHGKVDAAGEPTKAGLETYFSHRVAEYSRAKNPTIPAGGVKGPGNLAQVMLRLNLDDPTLVQHMIDVTPNAEQRIRWYNESHKGIEALGRGHEVVLGDGTSIDAADLLPQIIAVTSFQANPLTNLGNALHALGNWKDFQGASDAITKRYMEGMQKFLARFPEERTHEALVQDLLGEVTPKGRTRSGIVQTLGKNAGMYGNEGDHLKAITAILSGHTLDKWTPQDMVDLNVMYGGKAKMVKKGQTAADVLAEIPKEIHTRAREEATSARVGEYHRGMPLEDWQESKLTLPDLNDSGKEHVFAPALREAGINPGDWVDAEHRLTPAFWEDWPQARAVLEEKINTWPEDSLGGPDMAISYINHGEDLFEDNGAYNVTDTEVNMRAMALAHGDKAWAKILSFWQNLANPEASRAVTLDTWMARAFGLKDWSTPEDYFKYTQRLTSMADAAGISPHGLQALIWSYAKAEITKQAAERVWGYTTQTSERIAADPAFRLGGADDPIVTMLDWELSRPAEVEAAKAAGEDATMWEATDTTAPHAPEHGGPVEERPVTYARRTGPKALQPIKDQRAAYAKVAERANLMLEQGDTVGAQHEIAKWASGHAKKATVAEDASDFMDYVMKPNPRVREAAGRAGLSLEGSQMEMTLEGLANQVEAQVLGYTFIGSPEQQQLMRFFSGAGLDTLLHENIHVLRQIMTPQDVAILERAMGHPGIFGGSLHDPLRKALRVSAEERVVEEFMGYLLAGKAKNGGLQPVFERLRETMNLQNKAITQASLTPVVVPGDMSLIWEKYLDPVLPAEGAPMKAMEDLGHPRTFRGAPEGASAEQLVARNRPLPGESAQQAVRRQRRMDAALEHAHQREYRAAERMRRVAVIQKRKGELEEVLRTGATPAQKEIDSLNARINRITGRLASEMEDPKTGQVPPAFQPIKQTMDKLWKEAADDPALLDALDGLPKTFGEILRLAIEKGFDPTHIRSFTPNQVQRLVYDTIRLGVPGRNVGEEIIAGTRKPRVSGIPREQSLEALIAASVEATHEVQTNEVVSFLEEGIAKPIVGGVIPNTWEAWDPVRRWIVNGKEELPSGVNTKFSPEPTMMIPKSVGRAVRSMGRDYNHWAFRAIGKPSSLWRTFILSLSPRWYVNNLMGNISLATAEGVRFRDWAKAWQSYRQRGEGAGLLQRGPRQAAPFSDVPGVAGASIYHELEEPSMIGPSGGGGVRGMAKGLFKDAKGQPTKQKWVQVKTRLARANEAVDEIARSAVYHKTLRTTGSAEVALQRAYTALIDYGDLGPMERSLVRAVIPFYAWQKGVLKTVARIGYENPAAFAIVQRLTDMQREVLRDQLGSDLPEGYQGLAQIPGLGMVNTRGINPFQDAGQLIRANGIAESANPFIEAIVRNQLNAPETTRPEDYRVNPFGRLVPETNPLQTIGETFTSGLPQGQLALSLAGESPYTNAPTGATAAERFAGFNRLSQADIQRILERTMQSRATLTPKKETPQVKPAFQRFTGRGFQPVG